LKLFVLGLGLLIAGCSDRGAAWRQLTQNNSEMFFAPVTCPTILEPLQWKPQVIGNYSVVHSVLWNGGIPELFKQLDPRPKEPWPGDYYAYAITIVDQSERRTLNAFLLATNDEFGASLNLPYLGRNPPPITVATVAPSGTRIYPIPTSVTMCGYLARIPWSASSNLPYWMPSELMSPAVLEEYEARLARARFFLMIFMAVTITGLILLPFSFFDKENWEARDWRRRYLIRYVVVGALAVALLTVVTEIGLRKPFEMLLRAHDYYRFYNALPKADGILKPLSNADAQRLFAGPPLPEEMRQTDVSLFSLLGAVGAIIVMFGKRLYMGAYWLLVPLPLEVRFRRAFMRGRWPHAHEIDKAIRDETVGKNAWQAKAMERKAERFAPRLAAKRERLERKLRYG